MYDKLTNLDSSKHVRGENIITKKFLTILILFSITLTFMNPIGASSQSIVTAPSAILIDARSGQVLWSKNAHHSRAIASTTKIMTAILAAENSNIKNTAVASKRATDVGESEIYIKPGDILTIEQLLYASLLKSANDAVMVLAEKIGGSVEGFSKMMNDKANALGMKDSHFTNPHGLHNGSHRSSANDLAILARYAMKNKIFRKIAGTKKAIVPWPGKTQRLIENHNRLIGNYKYATGVKTGFTSEAGHCLVSSAKNGDKEVIAVILGGSSSAEVARQSQALLEWGLTKFSKKMVINKNRKFAEVKIDGQKPLKLISEKDLSILLPTNGVTPEIFAVPSKSIRLPIKAGQIIGTVNAYQNGETLGSVNLISTEDRGTLLSGSSGDDKLFSRVISFFKGLFD